MTTYADHYRDRISLLLQDLLTQNALAEQANADVKYQVDRLRSYCERRGYTEHSAREKKRNDYDLEDAVEAYRKRCSEVQRLSNVIQGIAAAVSLLDR